MTTRGTQKSTGILREAKLSDFRTASKVSPGDFYVAMDDMRKLSTDAVLPGATARTRKEQTTYAALHVEFDSAESCRAFNLESAPVISRIDRFADVFVSAETAGLSWEKIAALPGVVEIQPSGVYPLPTSSRELGAVSIRDASDISSAEEIVRDGVGELKGQGVIIAIVDSGIDFRNPDFITYDSQGLPTSRLLYYWDTTAPKPASPALDSMRVLSYPNGAPVGVLYTRKQLTSELRSDWPTIPSGDLLGHGTACAGVAAGNGNNDPAHRRVTKGVAPAADLIAVRIGGVKSRDGSVSGALKNGYLLDAICNWLDTVADNRPLVISCSWGSQTGGGPATRIVERQLNARFPVGTKGAKGRAIVFSTGNAAAVPWHAEVNLNANRMSEPVRWQTDKDHNAYVQIDFASNEIDGIRLAMEGVARLEELSVRVSPFTGRASAYAKVPPGDGALYIYDSAGRTQKVDLYINYGHFVGKFKTTDGMVYSPAAAANAIAVSSYDFNNTFNEETRTYDGTPIIVGSLSCYSSGGVVREGLVKPDIVAPGQIYHASYAKLLFGTGSQKKYGEGVPEDPSRVDKTNNYRLFDGTSAATPYVAGVVALMMQKYALVHKNDTDNQLMPLRDIKILLGQEASKDKFVTSVVPNSMWGNGKLDLAAVHRMLAKIDAQ